MKVKSCEHWQIAWRKQDMDKFQLVPNPNWAWAADPFLVKYEGEIYLFAELFLYKSERNGVIGYCKYDGKGFGEWTVTMDKHWHLSYPNVWVENEKLYMCPETYQAGEVAVYELVEFPNKWKKVCVLLDNVECVDSTFLIYDKKKYLFTYKHTTSRVHGELLLYPINDKGNFESPIIITENLGCARPGGNFINQNGKLHRVAQDCSRGYGAGLVFCEVESIFPDYIENEIMRIYPEAIHGEWRRKFTGIHTYNRYDTIEVIDLKYNVHSIREYFARKRAKKVFVDKYK
ncbi:MAG: hypothetical protein NC489_12770 [Ruminococcus flavefaciens]|nr:hypothetical protein [Ruminococcus flavefaciens]